MAIKWCVACVPFVLLIVALVGGCDDALATDHVFRDDVTRYIDDEAGVVCWIYASANRGGISCLPITDTKLGR